MFLAMLDGLLLNQLAAPNEDVEARPDPPGTHSLVLAGRDGLARKDHGDDRTE